MKKNIILIGIVFVVVIICILAAIIGFGISDEPKDDGRNSVNLSQNILGDKEKDDDDSKSETKESEENSSTKESETESEEETTLNEETTTKLNAEETSKEEETTSVKEPDEETTVTDDGAAEEETTITQTVQLDRLSYEYMIIDGKCVYDEYNVKLLELYESINEERADAGVKALVFDKEISYIACARASQLAFEKAVEQGKGLKYYELMGKSGISFSKAAENTAAGYEQAVDVVSGSGTSWKTSAKHYDNMISDKYTRVGVGVDYSETMGYVWVAIFSN